MPKKKHDKVDGLSTKDIARIRSAIREVWRWSTPRKICLERSMDSDGFGVCEACHAKSPKVFVDHIEPVGDVDAGFIKRLFVSSKGLQALCKKCHAEKTKVDKALLKMKKKTSKKAKPTKE